MTYQIIGAAMRVHQELGPGLLERSYQLALAMELDRRGIPYRREAPVQVFFDARPVGPPRKADFLCFERVPVALKAASAIHPVDIAQALHYLRASRLDVALVLNFGLDRLQFRRILMDGTERDARARAPEI